MDRAWVRAVAAAAGGLLFAGALLLVAMWMRGQRLRRIAAMEVRLGGPCVLAGVRDRTEVDGALGGLAVAALPYTGLCAAGFLIAVMPRLVPDGGTIGAAFLGAYLLTARMLLRAVQNEELTALLLLRCAAHVVQGIVIAMVAGRTIGTALPPSVLVGLGFVAGYAPDLGMAGIARRLRVRFAKPVDGAALDAVRVQPLELIDGIDGDIARRLEQGGWYDVQNLATANPVLVHVATPFGLHQVVDWIGQAQLCLGVGSRAFQDLHAVHVRTLFQLAAAPIATVAPILSAEADRVPQLIAMLIGDPHVARLAAVRRALMA